MFLLRDDVYLSILHCFCVYLFISYSLSLYLYTHIYIYIYMCVCVCVFVNVSFSVVHSHRCISPNSNQNARTLGLCAYFCIQMLEKQF